MNTSIELRNAYANYNNYEWNNEDHECKYCQMEIEEELIEYEDFVTCECCGMNYHEDCLQYLPTEFEDKLQCCYGNTF